MILFILVKSVSVRILILYHFSILNYIVEIAFAKPEFIQSIYKLLPQEKLNAIEKREEKLRKSK
jgi:uncharacterized spore protein YtfJ